MIKGFVHFTFLKLLPLWLAVTAGCLLLLPVLSPLHGGLAGYAWQIPQNKEASPLYYRLVDSLEQQIQWDAGSAPLLLSHNQSRVAADVSWREQLWLTYSWERLNQIFTAADSYVGQHSGTGLWRPASSANYKQVVWRNSDITVVDQVVQRNAMSASDTWVLVKAGFLEVPVDMFGGLYLFTNQAPLPQLASVGNFTAPGVNALSPENRQFLKEVWAIDNQHWAVTNWQMLLLASFLALLPWLIGHRLTKPVFVVGLLTLLPLLIGYIVLVQWNWVLPVILPVLSAWLALPWQRYLQRQTKLVQSLTAKSERLSEYWVGHLLDDNKPDAAARFLSDETQAVASVEQWSLVADSFERKREYEKAIDCWQTVLRLDGGHKEAKTKVKRLGEVVDGTKTMAIVQANAELPVGRVEQLSLGRYQISRELGRGAMGIVYEAEDPKIHRKVALKVVHLKSLGIEEVEAVKQRFFREAQAAGKLNHPNIVTVFDVGEEHDVAYIAMDLLLGQPLSEWINSEKIDLLQSVRWVAQAAEALAYAHDHDIIHRDVKPANMIIEQRQQRLKLTDFGVARIAGVQQTQTGIVLGSPSYMSPEQIRGETLTGQTDIFSLGVTLYQCITGKLPFEGETLPALAYAITQTKQKSPRTFNDDIPVSLVRIVNKALNKKPSERYDSANDMAKALNKWLADH